MINEKKIIVPLIGYLLFISMILYPFFFHFSQAVPGGGVDVFQFTWSFWHFKKALLQLANPFITESIFYPLQVNLILHVCTPTKSIIAFFLQIMGINTIAAYNSLIFYTFIASGLGTYLLILTFIPNRFIAFIGGFIFAFAPNQLAHTLGHLNVISVEAVPWLIYVWRLHIQQPHKWKLAALTLLSTYLFFCDYQLFLYTAILLIVYFIVLSIKSYQEAMVKLKLMIPVLILFFVIMIPFWIMAITVLKDYDLMSIHGRGWGLAEHYYMDLVSIFIPSETHNLLGGLIKKANSILNISPLSNESERTAFLGFSVLAIIGFGIKKNWSDKNIRFWSLVSILFLSFSHGPILHFMGIPINTISGFHLFSFDGIKVIFPMPYTLIHYLPVFNGARIPSRFIVMTVLAVAILFSIILHKFLINKQWSKQRQTIILIGLLLIITFEYWPQSYYFGDVKIPAVYQFIAKDKDKDRIVLDLPSSPWAYDLSSHYYQTLHEHKMIGGWTARFSRKQELYIKEYAPIIRALHNNQQVDVGSFYKMIDELNITYIVARNEKTINAIEYISQRNKKIKKIQEDIKLETQLWMVLRPHD